jgi:Zn-dependent M28 family amino/carboxypeptidase
MQRFLVALAWAGLCSSCKAPAVPDAVPPAASASLSIPFGPSGGAGDDDGLGGDGFDEAPKAVATAPIAPWMREAADKITAHAKGKTRAWERLAHMADAFGHRLSGSKALEDTIDWIVAEMKRDGLSDPRREKVMVPKWVRGAERLTIVSHARRGVPLLGLGMSVGTKGTLRAQVAVVEHVDDIAKQAKALAGKIVLINQAMPPYDHERQSSGYGEAVGARTRGASEAGKVGAKAVLVRSVTAHSLSTPHTGALRYDDGVPKIPAAAITVEGAEFIARQVAAGDTVTVELSMGAKLYGDVPSANVVAELRGRELPDEVVVIGGHIDSWDVGDGSTDDGAGCLMAWEAAVMLSELGLVPRRTIRVVLFTNEENGLRGAKAYFEAHGKETHVGAIEADSGSGAPQGLGIASEDAGVVATISSWGPLFAGIGASDISKGWGGADISPLTDNGVLSLSMRPDASHYFDLHHSPADTIDKVDPDDLQRNAAAMALMAYLLAER